MRVLGGSMVMALGFGGALVASMAAAQTNGERRVAVVFSGGHETDRRDGGRPVALIAAALGVPMDVFRDAFSRVTPSRNGPPSGDLQRRNKAALLGTLAPYGVTNERLDEVSNYYRYRPQEGEGWPNRPAKAVAIVSKGRIVRFEVIDAGSGYSAPPQASVPGFPGVAPKVSLAFDRRFERNGSVSELSQKGS